jgi:hypothetical protein
VINPTEFEDIKIVGLDTALTTESHRGSAMRNIHLRLSASPPGEWIQIFDGERSFPRHSMWRAAEVNVNHIVVDCVTEEIEQYHLRDLKEDVANANKKYRHFLTQVAQQQQQQQKAQTAEREQLEQLRERLDFN